LIATPRHADAITLILPMFIFAVYSAIFFSFASRRHYCRFIFDTHFRHCRHFRLAAAAAERHAISLSPFLRRRLSSLMLFIFADSFRRCH